jgi:hypothetical protein
MLIIISSFGISDVRAEVKTFTGSGQILEGEVWDWVNIYNDDTIVDMWGGTADVVYTFDGSTLNMFGGETEVSVWDYSTANISGGDLFAARAHDNGKINLFDDAQVGGLTADDFGIVNMDGGSADILGGLGSGTVNLYGGTVSDSINMGADSIINIFGYDLFKDSSGGAYGNGLVWGFFQDNTPFVIDLYGAETYSHVNLVPEPCTLWFVGLGILILRKRRSCSNV